MNLTQPLELFGYVEVESHNVVTGERVVHAGRNLITDAGRNVIRDLILGNGRIPSAIATGTGTTAAQLSDTALETEVFRAEIQRRASTNKVATMQLLIGTGDANGNTLTEYGLFDNTVASAPNLVARIVSGTIVKTVSIQVTVTWSLTVV